MKAAGCCGCTGELLDDGDVVEDEGDWPAEEGERESEEELSGDDGPAV